MSRAAPPEFRSRIPRRWRQRFVALAIGWLLLEVLALPYVGWLLPLRARARLPAPMYVLSQRSKSGLLPRDWVLVLGDSYAEGHGDWLTAALREGGNPPFQATDVLHRVSGRDVLSFGSGGADNVASTAFMVSKRFASLARAGLSDPLDVLVYFYEGNDLTDDLRAARRHFELEQRGPNGLDDAWLDAGIAERASKGFWSGLPGNVLLPYLALDALRGGTAGGLSNEGKSPVTPFAAGEELAENVFTSGGEHYVFRGDPSGPALELDASETDLALRMFARSLAWCRTRFAGARVRVVYLPSPLACYEIVSPRVRARATIAGREKLHPAASVAPRSAELRRRVREIAEAQGVELIDASDALAARGREEPVHGPLDGHHFNLAGYTVLGELLSRALE